MKRNILLQGVTQDNHLSAVRDVLGIEHPERIIISVAFMNERGLSLLGEALALVAEQTTVLAGIRNGITSAQGLRKSLEIGCSTYTVDTGSRNILFHPKIYLSRNTEEARLVVGSANLTTGGLISNIESSLALTIGLNDPENAALVTELEAKIDGMVAEYNEHVLLVPDNATIQDLLNSGRVIDESITLGPTTSSSSRRRDLDSVPQMNLKTLPIPRLHIDRFLSEAEEPKTPVPPNQTSSVSPISERLTLVWASKPLMRRHLTIPTGANTNQTGSMLFTKGALDSKDQRHYFREEVFGSLDWQFDTTQGREHIERTEARFQLVIRGISYAIFTLRLSHNSRTDTKAYAQRNSMTQLHWGDARDLIAREDLLNRVLYLYRDEVDTGLFVLEID